MFRERSTSIRTGGVERQCCWRTWAAIRARSRWRGCCVRRAEASRLSALESVRKNSVESAPKKADGRHAGGRQLLPKVYFSVQPHAHGGTSHTKTRCHPHAVHDHSQQLGTSATTPNKAKATNP